MKFLNSKQTAKCFKKRRPDSFKGQNGRATIIGGSSELVGAPALAALSAVAVLRSGADLVTVISPEKSGFAINAFSPDIIVKKVRGNFFSQKHLKTVLNHCKKTDAVLIGPGLGLEKATQKFVKKLVSKLSCPLVIDADAIKALKGFVFSKNCVITPHEKELEIFSGKKTSGKKGLEVKVLAKKHGCVILLKGKIDVISNGKKIFYNKTGNAGMTVGGTGDVLAGICTGLIAQKIPLLKSACCAAFINGKAGDALLKKKGFGFIASDLAEQIPITMKKMR